MFSNESQENPFVSDGELHKKADYIIRYSTISRTELKIADPDQTDETVEDVEICVQASESHDLESAPPSAIKAEGTISNSHNGSNRENGNVKDAAGSPKKSTEQPVEARVGKTVAPRLEPQKAEEVRLKEKNKCCCVQ